MSIFNEIKVNKPSTNRFDLSHDRKFSFNMGDLVPTLVAETLPGDIFNLRAEQMLRFQPLIAPVMHRVNVFTHYFFVPNRILWDGWKDFITGADQSDIPAAPYFQNLSVGIGTLGDFLGLPAQAGLAIDKVSALPFAAYNAVYDEYYRDQNLVDADTVRVKLVDGANDPAFRTTLRRRAWEHDYFTSALPWAQKGSPVQIPTGDVVLKNQPPGAAGSFYSTTGAFPTGTKNVQAVGGVEGNQPIVVGGVPAAYDPNGTLTTEGTINDLRRAWSLQKWLEKNARAGTRYVESLLSHWGVRSSDARLQRPEYLGGLMNNMVISEVLQTSQSTEDGTPQGNMAGHGIGIGNKAAFNYRCEEHGFIIGIMSVRPRSAYQQGVPKTFSRFDPMEYAWPDFAHIGEQEIKNRELFYSPSDGANDAVFGYTPRYSEYKYMYSTVHGDFRGNLNYWHMGRIFSERPGLNETFINVDPDYRQFAVTDPTEDHILAHVFNDLSVIRKLPKFGTPL